MNSSTSSAVPHHSLVVPRAERSVRVVSWQPWPLPNPSLIGHATIAFAGSWEAAP